MHFLLHHVARLLDPIFTRFGKLLQILIATLIGGGIGAWAWLEMDREVRGPIVLISGVGALAGLVAGLALTVRDLSNPNQGHGTEENMTQLAAERRRHH